MRNKVSWFSVAIHPAFLIEDELEKSKRSAAAKATAASLQLGLFPELESKPQSVSPQTSSADLDEQRRGLIETLQAPARQVISKIGNKPPAAPEAPAPVVSEPVAPKPQSPAEKAAAAQAKIREGYLARTATQARTEAPTEPEIEPVVPEIHPNDKISPTGDSPSLVGRIGGHLQNLKDRLSRIFGSSPEARASEVSAPEAATPEVSEPEASEPETPAERAASARAKIREGYLARTQGDPNSQALAQNLIEQPVGQVDNPDPESVSTQTPSTGRPLSEIRTLGDAKAHSEKLDAVYRDADAAHKANPSDDTEAAYWKTMRESIAADEHFAGHQKFEDAHTTDLLHGSDAISTLRKNNINHPVSGKWVGSYSKELTSMADAMQQRIEDAGGIHEAMKNPELAPKIRLVLEAWEHMRETFPDRYAAMESDEHDGDVLERPLEGIRNTEDAFDHANKVDGFFRDESHKFNAMADGSPEKKAQSLLLEKADEASKRAFAHWNALCLYGDNDLNGFVYSFDGLDPQNMSEEDREKYRIRMNAANTVLKQKIEAAGGKDYAQYHPRLKAFQDRIRQIAEAHQAAGQAPNNRSASNRGMLRQREASAQQLSEKRDLLQQPIEAKRQAEIAEEQERQRNLQELMDGLAPSVGSIKRRR